MALVAIASVAVLRPPGQLADLLLVGLIGLVAVAFVLAWRSGLDGLEVQRRLPRVATKGEALLIVHEVVNVGGRVVRDLALAELWEGGGSRTFFHQLPPGTRAEARTRMFLGQRGRLVLKGVVLQHGDPFGLFSTERVVPLPGQVLVQPRPRSVAGAMALARALRRGAGGFDAQDWASVREWREGDPLRFINWRLTARRGYPVVRVSPNQPVSISLIVLDRALPGGPRAEAEFEKAVSLAAGLGLAMLGRGTELRFLAPGAADPVALDGLRGRAGASRLLEALALIAPDGAGLGAASDDLAQAALVTARSLTPHDRRRYACTLETRRLLPGGVAEIPPTRRRRAVSA